MTKDLTTGKIMPILVKFTIPLVLGNLFQLTYNAVDSIIVGHFVGKEALAAVGICILCETYIHVRHQRYFDDSDRSEAG